jgi:hypothetical protein
MERVEPRSPGPGGAEEDGAAPHPPRPPWLSAPWLIGAPDFELSSLFLFIYVLTTWILHEREMITAK